MSPGAYQALVAGAGLIAKRLRFHGVVAWIAGGLSGFFGGLVGNQGGIRSAAMREPAS